MRHASVFFLPEDDTADRVAAHGKWEASSFTGWTREDRPWIFSCDCHWATAVAPLPHRLPRCFPSEQSCSGSHCRALGQFVFLTAARPPRLSLWRPSAGHQSLRTFSPAALCWNKHRSGRLAFFQDLTVDEPVSSFSFQCGLQAKLMG